MSENNNNNNNTNLSDILRGVFMAGLGAVSFTVEKSKELASALINKGEKTAKDSGFNYDETRDQLAKDLRDIAQKVHEEMKNADFEDLLERLDELDDEQRAIARDRIDHPLKCEEQTDDACQTCDTCEDKTACDTCDKPDDEPKE